MKARTDLRRLLTADALTTVPAIGERAELDPIFKLIAAHKAAWAQFMELDAAPRKIAAIPVGISSRQIRKSGVRISESALLAREPQFWDRFHSTKLRESLMNRLD